MREEGGWISCTIFPDIRRTNHRTNNGSKIDGDTNGAEISLEFNSISMKEVLHFGRIESNSLAWYTPNFCCAISLTASKTSFLLCLQRYRKTPRSYALFHQITYKERGSWRLRHLTPGSFQVVPYVLVGLWRGFVFSCPAASAASRAVNTALPNDFRDIRYSHQWPLFIERSLRRAARRQHPLKRSSGRMGLPISILYKGCFGRVACKSIKAAEWAFLSASCKNSKLILSGSACW